MQIHKTESRLEFIGVWGVKEMRNYFLMVKEFLFGDDERSLELAMIVIQHVHVPFSSKSNF